jgi:DNA-binding transcriptional ArsR family regulator
MKRTPGLARIAALVGDPARARMLAALMGGRALTATELSAVGEVAPSTASAHLSKMAEAGLLAIEKQGRHRYYRLDDRDVAAALEGLMGVASRARPEVRTGPVDLSLRAARVCFDHLAGEAGVRLLESLQRRGFLTGPDGTVVSPEGERFFGRLGIAVPALAASRRPLCRTCLDWSERRFHLAGALGAALLDRIFGLGWARRETGGRAVLFSVAGERAFRARFEG